MYMTACEYHCAERLRSGLVVGFIEGTCMLYQHTASSLGIHVAFSSVFSGMSAATASKEAVEAVGLLGVCVSGMSAATASIEAAEAVGLL